MNNFRALKNKFCQKISVQYAKCILCDTCLKNRIFAANVQLINDFATQLFYISIFESQPVLKNNVNSCNFFDKFEKLFMSSVLHACAMDDIL